MPGDESAALPPIKQGVFLLGSPLVNYRRKKSMTIKKGITNERVAHHQKTHKRTGVWWIPEEYEQLQANAKHCGLNASEYVRRCSLGQKITPLADTETLSHLMKLGGLQKKMITDLRISLADNADISKLITATDDLYSKIQAAILNISRR